MATQIHQFSTVVSYGDAISDHIVSVQRLLARLGYGGEIFCERAPLHFEGRVRLIADYARYSSPENILLLHFGLGYSTRVLAWLEQIPDRKVLVYHNITPEFYFAGVNHLSMEEARVGRSQLRELRALTEGGWGDSTYNCRELAERGWVDPRVLPIVFEPQRYDVRPDRRVLKHLEAGLNMLFVGRVAPNKRHEDLILTFYYVKRCVSPDARLILVGSSRGMEPYLDYLRTLVRRLDLSDVLFTGHVSTSQLVAYYQCASVYLSMSEHEGFGVPFVESMYFGVPVVAYKAAAVSETLDGSGILFKAKDHPAVAGLIGLLGQDKGLRERVVARGRARLQSFMPDAAQSRLSELLHGLGV